MLALDLVLAMTLLAGCGGGPVAQSGTAAAPASAAFSGPRAVLPDGSSVAVEVVADPDTRARGLMYRPALAGDRGMLFLFPEAGPHSFWMKDTLIPLDMIWLDADRRVIAVERNVPPCRADPCPSYGPSADAAALYVLELAAGQAEARRIEPGVVIELRDIGQYTAR
ncbi:MAG: DUF192 domain-containing protein [Thermoanaerobaculia bacterium]